MTVVKESFVGDDRHEAMVQTIVQMADLMTHPRQVEYWRGLAAQVRPVRVVSAYDVWSADKVALLKKIVRPAKNECYRTAAMLCLATDGQVRYVEGQMWVCCLGVSHAFNYIPDKGVYVDFTAEFALNRNPSQEAYVAFRDFDSKTVWRIIEKNKYYGEIYGEVWLSENQKNR